MSILSRQYIFVSGTKILAEEWTAELSQLYRFLSGALSGQLILKQNTTNPGLIVENSQEGEIVIEFQNNSVPVFRILGSQQLESLVTGTSPFLVTSRTKVARLNAKYLNGLLKTAFFNNGKKVESYIPIKIAASVGVKSIRYIVPAGTNMSLVNVNYDGFSGGMADAEITIELKKNGGVINTVTLLHPLYKESRVLAVGVVENDVISVDVTIVDVGLGNPPTFVGIRIKMLQDLIT